MRAIKIEPSTKEITECEIDGTVESVQKMVQGDMEPAGEFPNGDVLYVNEEGLYEFSDHFMVPGARNTLAGPGLIVGPENQSGKPTAARTSLEEARNLVKFTSSNSAADFVRGFGRR